MVTDAVAKPLDSVAHGSDVPLLHFPQPLVPFGGVKDYLLERRPDEQPFAWLRAVDQPGLALVVAPYEELAGEPGPAANATVRALLGASENDTLAVYVVVAIGASLEDTTMNLLAPVYHCPRTGRACQVVLDLDVACARVRLLPQGGEPGAGTHPTG